MRQPTFWNLAKADDGLSAQLRICGDIVDDDTAWLYRWLGISGTSPCDVRAQLDGLLGVPLTVWIDSPGGDVVAASAIYTALMEYPGRVTGKVDGAAYSAASVIAMACETLLMSPTAMMMIHLPWTSAEGNARAMRHTADVLDEVSEALVSAYRIKTGKARAEILAMLEAETWMSAQKAVALGFADGLLYGFDSEQAQEGMMNRARAVYALGRKTASKPEGDPRESDWAAWAAMRQRVERQKR